MNSLERYWAPFTARKITRRKILALLPSRTEGTALNRQISVGVRPDFSSQPLISRGEKEGKLPSRWLPDPSVCLTLAKSRERWASYQVSPLQALARRCSCSTQLQHAVAHGEHCDCSRSPQRRDQRLDSLFGSVDRQSIGLQTERSQVRFPLRTHM
ncbi:unnamed protein product [Pipistrellus nathusii]|uniref:Uncharacterized protein n=1 Tax=Pipistrellus nathusii TaxID=59473 RepID=A0ABN9ZPN8_PIPNA